MTEDFCVLISNDDLRAARAAWLTASLDGQPDDRLSLLHEDIERLTRVQIQQVDDGLRRYMT